MHNVVVRFDLEKSNKTIKFDGETEEYPILGQPWSFIVTVPKGHKVYVDMGTVININCLDDMMLIQTELVVAEVWISNKYRSADILPLSKDSPHSRNKLLMKSLSNFRSKLNYLKDDGLLNRKLKFKLILGESK